MAGHTKMIIITSNEDVIRQFTVNNTPNTQIIDLDNKKQMASLAKNTNMNNLTLLAELSELDSNNDHVFKRALDSSDHRSAKSIKTTRKQPVDLTCTICGDRAIGYNYDVLSCASCKAFFRRNAFQNLDKLRCLTGQGKCSVAHDTRRKCQRCRLDRCFSMGMRKDFILSEEEKQRRKERLEENRSNTSKRLSTTESTDLSQYVSNSQILDEIDHLLMDMNQDNGNMITQNNTTSNGMKDISLNTLSVEDWMTIENLHASFLTIYQDDHSRYPNFDATDRATALIFWSQKTNQVLLRLINFFLQIDEFSSLHADDRFILIKYNLFPTYPVFKCYQFNGINGFCSSEDNEEAMKHRRFIALCFESTGMRDSFINVIVQLAELTEKDPKILSLLFAVLIFSQGLSLNEDEPALNDPLVVYRAQSHFTKLLWNYMIYKRGERKTTKQFSQLLKIILDMQLTAKRLREFFRVQFISSNSVDKIEPLIQSVLNIS